MSILLKLLVISIASIPAMTQGPNSLPGRVRLTATDFDAFYDFVNGSQNFGDEDVSVFESFRYAGCATKGVLKISLSEANGNWHRRRVLIDMLFSFPSGWAFNLGDSPSNKGSGGDKGSSSNDAEMVYNHGYVTAYLNQQAGNRRAFRLPDLFSTRLTLIVGDRHAVWFPDDMRKANYFYSQNFFALNNQPDTESLVADNNIYLGINKVVESGSFRTGAGLCAVGIKFLPEL